MTLPDSVSDDFLRAVEHIAKTLSSKFKLVYEDGEDMHQLVALWSLEALPKYRPDLGGLPAFLYRNSRNRLINKIRDEYSRNTDVSCPVCRAADLGEGPGHNDGEACKKHLAWKKRNQAKASIARPVGIDHVYEDVESRTMVDSSVVEDAATKELLQLIDAKLPMRLRPTYLQMRAEVEVPKARRLQVERAVQEILEGVIDVCPSEND